MDDLAADLPPQRDDEPASLRQDIVDELADHLQCALRREQLAPGNSADRSTQSTSEAAWQRVLVRFGNPAAIARQLWLDAMKERLMAQKLTILWASVATAAVLALSVVMWQAQQRAVEAQRVANEAQIRFSEGILKSLESLGTPSPGAAAPSTAEGWAPLTIKLVSEVGGPVQGQVTVLGTTFNVANPNISQTRTADANGVADFGMLPYGSYMITPELNESNEQLATDPPEHPTEPFMLAPGKSTEKVIVCPTAPPPEVDLQFELNVPPDLHREDLRFGIRVFALPRDVGSSRWESVDQTHWDLWVDADGRVLNEISQVRTVRINGATHYVELMFREPPTLRGYEYRLNGVDVYVPTDSPDRASEGEPADQHAVRVQPARYKSSTLQPQPGQANEWQIEVPAFAWTRVIEQFRESSGARHALIPEGLQAFTLKTRLGLTDHLPSQGIHFVNLALFDTSQGDLDQDSQVQRHLLLESVRLLSTVQISTDTHLILAVTPEQEKTLTELNNLLRTIPLRILRSKDELDTPILHEDTVGRLREMAERTPPEEP